MILTASGNPLLTFSGGTWYPGRTGNSTQSNPRDFTKEASSGKGLCHGLVKTENGLAWVLILSS